MFWRHCDGSPLTRESLDYEKFAIFDQYMETIQEIVYYLSNGAIFNDLRRPLCPDPDFKSPPTDVECPRNGTKHTCYGKGFYTSYTV